MALTVVLSDVLLCVLLLLFTIIVFFKWNYTYWKRRGLEFVPPTFPFGNIKDAFLAKESFAITASNIYKGFREKGLKHGGYYILSNPVYMPVDAEYIKNILIKDFQHFVDRNLYYNEKDDPLTAHLINVNGQQWKNLRLKLTPSFTLAKLKLVFQTFLNCSNHFVDVVGGLLKNNEPVEIKDLVARYTIDIIGSCAFGVDCDSLENPDSVFTKHGKDIFNFNARRIIKFLFCQNFPKIARFLKLKHIPENVSKFFTDVVQQNVDYREKTGYYRKDFLQLLLDTRKKQLVKAKELDKSAFSIPEITAQAYLFFAAGFETSATTMSFCLFELASNADVQQKVREEIAEVLDNYDGNLCYDSVMEMTYLEKVIHESLRKHPPVPQLVRVCTKDYQVPNTDFIIKKGTAAYISPLGVHHDPEYYPEPEKFDPERFNEENKAKRPPCTYLPFGDGPRNCIGLRFGMLQVKVGIANLIKNYNISVNCKTELPLKISKKNSVVYNTEGGIYLNLDPLNCSEE